MAHLLKISSAIAAAATLLAGCTTATGLVQDAIVQPAVSETIVESSASLRALPAPRERAAVAVYSFEDQTGQFKPTSGVQTLSKAVTQGATSVLLKALQDAGNRSWFTVIERENLDNLLKERQIIREMRRQYLGEEEVNEAALPPLLFAGIILEGGVIGYDSNTVTGGIGARFLGIGAQADYREDKVTVYLRAVSVKTGEVITTVVASKKIASVGVASNVFRYVSYKELLEVDTGITTNEPDLLALRQATEKAVELLILEGADLGVWGFRDQVAGNELLERYRAERDGVYDTLESAYAAKSSPAETASKSVVESDQSADRESRSGPDKSNVASNLSGDTPAAYTPASVNADMPTFSTAQDTRSRETEQNTAKTISAVPAAVQPVALGDGGFRLTAAEVYIAANGSLAAPGGSTISMADIERRRVAEAALRNSVSGSNLEGV